MVQMKLRRRVETHAVKIVQKRLENVIKTRPVRPFNSKPVRSEGEQDRKPPRTTHTQTKPRAELEKIATKGSMGEIIKTLENGHLEQAGGYREAAIVGLPEDIQNNLADRLYRKRKLQRALIKAVSYAVPIALISTLALAGVNSGAIGLVVLFSVIFKYVVPKLMKDISIKPGQIAGLLESGNKLAEDARQTIAKLSKEELSAWSPRSRTDTKNRVLMKPANEVELQGVNNNTWQELPRFNRFEGPPADGWITLDERYREQQAEAECLEATEQQTKRTR